MTFSIRFVCFLSLIVAAVLSSATLSAAEPVRTWTDSTGAFKVQATLVSYEAGIVKLTKSDGTTVRLPFERLSLDDQRYVLAYDAKNPFRPRNDIPPQPSGLSISSVVAPSAGSRVGSVAGASAPTLEQRPGTQPFSVAISPAFSPKPFHDRSFVLPSGKTGERLGGLWTDVPDASAMLGLWYEPSKNAVSTRAMRIDLSTGQADAAIDLPAGLTPLGWDGAGFRVVCRDLDKTGSSEAATLAVVRLEGGRAKTVFQVQPRSQPVWAAFCQGERLATVLKSGRFVIWSLATGEALATCEGAMNYAVARSGDGRIVAVGVGSDVFFYDVTTLSQVGCIAVVTAHAIAFSPDGTRVAVRATTGGVWNLADMTKVAELDGTTYGPLYFADSKSLYDVSRMIDVDTGAALWEIQGDPGKSASAGDRAWFVFEEKSRKTRRIHPENPRAPGTAGLASAPTGFLLPPNQPIRVDVGLLPKGEDHAKVKAHLEDSVRKAGHEVDDNASMTLFATAWPQEKPTLIPYAHTRQASWDELRGPSGGFGSFGASGNLPGFPSPADLPQPPDFTRPPDFGPPITVVDKITIYAVRIWEMKLELNVAGQTLWSKAAIPMQKRDKLLVPKGYSIEDFVARLASDDLQTFLTMSVPKSIPRGGVDGGTLELTMAGLEPVKN